MKLYTIKIDRPIGHNHHGTIYPVNYGYVPELIAGDDEEQDVYILSRLTENQIPLTEFTGKLTAIIHRKNDVEDKWVMTSEHETFTKEEIFAQTYFMEQYFDSEIELL
ncbi:inorganic pyrophosphatase [Lactococcus allomyrinae]|uniref:Inorganic pyrophosphatase n=1 Tax=Lactococcus allomyrinae TaxID=2419773 RepID=A0A387B7E1_9LACT|nr:inorganic pyrophosphatase [Lactococcus allomyrinae]AYF99684.1 inorganic pyrophosphatase [Lactococcus allomyrinae]